jgi:hypothetical protein
LPPPPSQHRTMVGVGASAGHIWEGSEDTMCRSSCQVLQAQITTCCMQAGRQSVQTCKHLASHLHPHPPGVQHPSKLVGVGQGRAGRRGAATHSQDHPGPPHHHTTLAVHRATMPWLSRHEAHSPRSTEPRSPRQCLIRHLDRNGARRGAHMKKHGCETESQRGNTRTAK